MMCVCIDDATATASDDDDDVMTGSSHLVGQIFPNTHMRNSILIRPFESSRNIQDKSFFFFVARNSSRRRKIK